MEVGGGIFSTLFVRPRVKYAFIFWQISMSASITKEVAKTSV